MSVIHVQLQGHMGLVAAVLDISTTEDTTHASHYDIRSHAVICLLLSSCSLLPALPCSVLFGTTSLNNRDFPNGQVVFRLPLCTCCSLSLKFFSVTHSSYLTVLSTFLIHHSWNYLFTIHVSLQVVTKCASFATRISLLSSSAQCSGVHWVFIEQIISLWSWQIY